TRPFVGRVQHLEFDLPAGTTTKTAQSAASGRSSSRRLFVATDTIGSLACHEDPDDDRSLVFASTARRLVAVAPLTGALEWAANLDAGSGEKPVTSFPNPDGLTVVTFDPTAGKMRLHRFGTESGVAKRTATVKAEWLTSLQRLAEQLGHAGPWQSVEEIGGQDLFQLTSNSGAVVAMLDANRPDWESLPAGSLLRYRGQVRFLLRQQGDGGGGVTLEASSSSSLVASNKISLSFASHHGRVSQLYPVTFCPQSGSSYGYRGCHGQLGTPICTLSTILAKGNGCERSPWRDELVTPGGSVFSSFAQRLSGQVHHFIHVLQHLMLCWRALGPPVRLTLLANSAIPTRRQPLQPPLPVAPAAAPGSLIRDEFNLHKLLVVATKDGQIGCPGFLPRDDRLLADGQMPLYIQRTTAHFPLEPMATVLCRDSSTGRPVLFSFNPITGIGIGLAQRLQSRLLQALLVPQPSHDNGQYIRPLMLLSDTLQVTLYPAKTALPHGFKSLNLYTIDRDNRSAAGLSPPPDGAAAADVGDINLAAGSARANSGHGGQTTNRAGALSRRVLGNRHVLYKYLNPNLLAVATLAKDMVTPAPQIGDAYTQAFLDPRRPFDMTPEFQEEGLMPYHPEVPMSTQGHTCCLCTARTCSALGCNRRKMFDVLKADFDYAFIAAVTIGMIIGSFVTQRLAARKALFRLWS
uniref:EMC1_C domain-containing protein n=1 Tax=Macrostomum lignano TaxID=282301 RepID=A0A1I8FB07_9PLAT